MSSSLLVLSLRRIAALLSVVLALVGGACDQRGGVATTKKGDLEKEEAEAARKAKEDQKIAEEALAAAAAEETDLNKGAKVTFLGYHKFTGAGTGTDMRIRMSEFRKQMQTLKDSGIAVISMSDFLAWRRGEKSIPQQSAIISIDDGYNSIYHLAFPVLKEFGYPFLIYIYTNYFGGGGKTLTATQIKEMIKAGAEVGSHSKSHPYDLRSRGGRSQEAYDKYLGEELVGSRKTLEEKLKIKGKVRTFAYPGGSYSNELAKRTEEMGYEASLTVSPRKNGFDTPLHELGRYIVFGNDSGKNFQRAIAFKGQVVGGSADGQINLDDPASTSGKSKTIDISTRPENDAIISNRLPLIEADLSKLGEIDPSGLRMRVSGYGIVPAKFDPGTRKFSFQIRQRLRVPRCLVIVTYSLRGREVWRLRWTFQIEKLALYLSESK